MKCGRITQATGAYYEVEVEKEALYVCQLRGKVKTKGFRPVVGDKVRFLPQCANQTGVIEEIKPRRNYFARHHPYKSHHLLAANLDHVWLVLSMRDPAVPIGFIDRVLCAAEAQHIPLSMLWNKQDLLTLDDKTAQTRLMDYYQQMGYACHAVSALRPGTKALMASLLMRGTHLLCGFSGVGKSTLLNALCAYANQNTSPISHYHRKGTHTTSVARLFAYKLHTALIDTPGVKTFGLHGVKRAELAALFPDLRPIAGRCAFSNCSHLHEPNCAIQSALKAGKLKVTRYHSYQQIWHSLSD